MSSLTDAAALHRAALAAGAAGDLRALLRLSGGVSLLVSIGQTMPGSWLWDPTPVVYGEKHPPLALCGPELLALWHDEEHQASVSSWLARALGRAYAGDWGDLGREDAASNKRSLADGSRLLCVYPWYGEPAGSRDLWVWIEAAHGDDLRSRRVSVLHRADY